jgi:hypothetical protein
MRSVYFTQPYHPIISNVTDMVATAVHVRQLYTARRILAEIQHRINGFNTYG